jgi:hypothetical protein
VSPGSFDTPLFSLPWKNKKDAKKNKGVGRVLFFDILSITLVVSGQPIGGVVCLSKCRVDVVDCSFESAGQLVYGPRICFLGYCDPCLCKTSGCTTSSCVARSLRYAIYDGFLDVNISCMLHTL